jgi:hypothetical protein
MAVNPVKTPFTNMSFTPDVPSSVLSATEYNAGYNVETDVRSIKSVLGDQYILSNIPGNTIFMTSGFRNNDVFWFIMATEQGSWYAMNQTGNIANITPVPMTGVITSNTTFNSLSGTSSSVAAGTYTAVAPITTSGGGIQATFNVTITSDGVPYNSTGAVGASTTFGNITGNAGATAQGIYSNIARIRTSGSGTGSRYTVVVNTNSGNYANVATITAVNGGINYAVNDTVTITGNLLGGVTGNLNSTTKFTGFAGNSAAASRGKYTNLTATSNSAIGTGGTFTVYVNANSAPYAGNANVTVQSFGNNYVVGDTFTIYGNTIGGAYSTNNLLFTLANASNNDLTFTIQSAVSNVATITTVTGGQQYGIGNTVTISGNVLNGNFTNNLTFTLGGNVSTINIGNFGPGVYSNSTVITADWNGSTVFLNDQTNPPMYLTPTATEIGVFGYPDPVTDQTYIWNYDVTTSSTGNLIPLYSSLSAGFVRVYNSPNVGTLLISGNLSGVVAGNVTYPTPGSIQNLPTTIRWSQNFGLNSGPTTWAPTLTNIANEVEVPLRGPAVDGFALNGNFYVFSYWDCVQFSPIAYTSTSAPVFGILLVTQGRGLLNENCFAIQDSTAYGVDARDIWSFNGGTFTPIGDQRVKNYFYNNLNAAYVNQVFMVNNTAKYQIEIYYPDLYSTGQCNQMLSYRYDLQIWNPPRQVTQATSASEAPRFYSNVANLATRGLVYSSFANTVPLIQKDVGTSFINGAPIPTLFERDNISFGQSYSASVQVHRVYPEVYGTGNLTVTVGGSDTVADAPTFNNPVNLVISSGNPWVQIDQNEARVTSIQLSSNSAVNSWQVAALNWQVTQVQDTR